MTELVTGWTFTDQATLDWQEFGTGVAMKTLGGANGRAIALFKFDAGYVGSPHEHTDAEFSYILEGDLISNGVTMTTGHAYAAEAGTTHEEFRTEGGVTLVSVFELPT